MGMQLLDWAVVCLWTFLPAFVANHFPGLAAWFVHKIGKPHWNRPVWEAGLGSHKTWLAYPVAIAAATATIYLQRWTGIGALFDYERSDLWLIGVAFGFGVVFGDHVKSFLKRRMRILPGDPWRPFDQLDFVLGGLLAIAPLLGWQVFGVALVVVPVTLAFHHHVNALGYRLGLRKVPH